MGGRVDRLFACWIPITPVFAQRQEGRRRLNRRIFERILTMLSWLAVITLWLNVVLSLILIPRNASVFLLPGAWAGLLLISAVTGFACLGLGSGHFGGRYSLAPLRWVAVGGYFAIATFFGYSPSLYLFIGIGLLIASTSILRERHIRVWKWLLLASAGFLWTYLISLSASYKSLFHKYF